MLTREPPWESQEYMAQKVHVKRGSDLASQRLQSGVCRYGMGSAERPFLWDWLDAAVFPRKSGVWH